MGRLIADSIPVFYRQFLVRMHQIQCQFRLAPDSDFIRNHDRYRSTGSYFRTKYDVRLNSIWQPSCLLVLHIETVRAAWRAAVESYRFSAVKCYCNMSHWLSQDFVLRGPENRVRDAEDVERGGVSPSPAD